jgi:hypothetical protein
LLDGYDDLRCFRGIPTNLIPRPDPPTTTSATANLTDARKEQKLQQQQRLQSKIQHLQTKIQAGQGPRAQANQSEEAGIQVQQPDQEPTPSLQANQSSSINAQEKPHPPKQAAAKQQLRTELQRPPKPASKEDLQMHLLDLKLLQHERQEQLFKEPTAKNQTEHIYELHHDEHHNATLAEFIEIQHELEKQEALEKQRGSNRTDGGFDSHSTHHAFPEEDHDDEGYFVQDDDLNRNSRDEDDDCIP